MVVIAIILPAVVCLIGNTPVVSYLPLDSVGLPIPIRVILCGNPSLLQFTMQAPRFEITNKKPLAPHLKSAELTKLHSEINVASNRRTIVINKWMLGGVSIGQFSNVG
jgi:hypothetical protein